MEEFNTVLPTCERSTRLKLIKDILALKKEMKERGLVH